MISVNGLTEEARVALERRNIPFRKQTRMTRHTYNERWEVSLPEGTLAGGDGFQYEDVPEEYDPYYRQGPTLPRSIKFFQLPDGLILVQALGKDLDVFEGSLPSYEGDSNYKAWAKASPFAQWEITGNSPHAEDFLKRWESNPSLCIQAYAQNAYNHIMQEDPRVHVEMMI